MFRFYFVSLLILLEFTFRTLGSFNSSNIVELTRDDNFYRTLLPKLLYKCFSLSLEPKSMLHIEDDSSSILDSVFSYDDCRRNLFLFQFHSSLFISKEPLSPSTLKEKAIKVDLITEDTAYQTIFEDFVLKSRAFKLRCLDCHGPSNKEVDSAQETDMPWLKILTSQSTDTEDSQTSEISSAKEVSPGISIPSLAYNSYYRRIDANGFNFFADTACLSTPCIITLPPEQASQLNRCPAKAHSLLWGYEDRQQNERSSDPAVARIRVFDPQHQSVKKYFSLLNSSSIDERNGNILFSEPFAKHGFQDIMADEDQKSGNKMPIFGEVSLSHNEMLFLPHSLLSSVYMKNGGALGILCFVDASNFKEHSNFLHMISPVSSSATNLLSTLSIGSHNSADLTMNRVVKSLSLKEFSYYEHNKEEKPGVEQEIEEQTKASRNRRNKRKDFKSWQEQASWKAKTEGFLVPHASIPLPIQTGRNFASFSWEQNFMPADSDKTTFGFDVVICKASEDLVIVEDDVAINRTDSYQFSFVSNPNSCELFRYLYPGNSSITAEARLVGQKEVYKFILTVNELTPDSYYQIKSRIVFGDNLGSFSTFSTRVHTKPLTAPSRPLTLIENSSFLEASMISAEYVGISRDRFLQARLRFKLPMDNGGEAIERYLVRAKVITEGFSDSWFSMGYYYPDNRHGIHWAAIDRNVTCYSLFPGLQYQFQVAAISIIGQSEYSARSNDLQIPSEDALSQEIRGQRFVVYGPSIHPAATLGLESQKNRTASSAVDISSFGETLLVVPVDEQRALRYDIFKETYRIWSSHWTQALGLERVVAESCFVSDVTLIDAFRGCKGRVAFVPRGGMALFQLAVLAQKNDAIAVVIVDGGQCSEYDQACIPGASQRHGEGFAAQDIASYWRSVRIPVFFALKGIFEIIQNAMERIPAYLEAEKVQQRLQEQEREEHNEL